MKYNKVKWAGVSAMGDQREATVKIVVDSVTIGEPCELSFGTPEKRYGTLGSIRIPRKC